MQQVKVSCHYCPPRHHTPPFREGHGDWEMHPSWIAGVEALNAYSDWVSSVVLPIAFQWIEEHKPEVYSTVHEDLRDDVGVVMAAAFRLVRELPAYKNGKTNPVWTGIAKKIRTGTEEAFAEQASLLGDIPE
jgi:hypothetical protein